ncbi:copper chaperone PCu(A)C [Teredinibacter waterburyi]|jgi:Uncharacterized protein conserved in bacteria|uniref:copper chaperone PCu(A)C n=1 Tax=Teredinibacter waterburyi TaxID=1500538 RepID=UPI00165F19F9|nr:copper chaperone PCu(A)C [Teredinibacter waterburyi]
MVALTFGRFSAPMIFVVLVTLCGAGCSQDEGRLAKADAVPLSGVSVTGAMMPQLPPGQKVGAVYFKIINNSAQTVTTAAIQSPISERIEIHRTYYDDGMMQMRKLANITLAPGESLAFSPGGHHLMLFDIASQPAVGDSFPLSLYLSGQEPLEITVKVTAIH